MCSLSAVWYFSSIGRVFGRVEEGPSCDLNARTCDEADVRDSKVRSQCQWGWGDPKKNHKSGYYRFGTDAKLFETCGRDQSPTLCHSLCYAAGVPHASSAGLQTSHLPAGPPPRCPPALRSNRCLMVRARSRPGTWLAAKQRGDGAPGWGRSLSGSGCASRRSMAPRLEQRAQPGRRPRRRTPRCCESPPRPPTRSTPTRPFPQQSCRRWSRMQRRHPRGCCIRWGSRTRPLRRRCSSRQRAGAASCCQRDETRRRARTGPRCCSASLGRLRPGRTRCGNTVLIVVHVEGAILEQLLRDRVEGKVHVRAARRVDGLLVVIRVGAQVSALRVKE